MIRGIVVGFGSIALLYFTRVLLDFVFSLSFYAGLVLGAAMLTAIYLFARAVDRSSSHSR